MGQEKVGKEEKPSFKKKTRLVTQEEPRKGKKERLWNVGKEWRRDCNKVRVD